MPGFYATACRSGIVDRFPSLQRMQCLLPQFNSECKVTYIMLYRIYQLYGLKYIFHGLPLQNRLFIIKLQSPIFQWYGWDNQYSCRKALRRTQGYADSSPLCKYSWRFASDKAHSELSKEYKVVCHIPQGCAVCLMIRWWRVYRQMWTLRPSII